MNYREKDFPALDHPWGQGTRASSSLDTGGERTESSGTIWDVWSADCLKALLLVNGYAHAAFDFQAQRGYCRTGFPPNIQWSQEGHSWSDGAMDLFK
jgi:Uncharacterized protein conserved in bacteria (DUF2251)